jgi:hypothetical protein
MNTAAFYRANRRITDGYVKYKNDRVILLRPTRVKTATGGYEDTTVDATPVQEVTVLSQFGEDLVLQTPDGVSRVATYLIIAPVDTDIRLNDYFVDENGREHTVTHIMPNNGFEFRAATVHYGR